MKKKIKKAKKCKPRKYAVVTFSGRITYGFSCSRHKIYSRRYSTEEIRDNHLDDHLKDYQGSPRS